jgi:hypothetical protein
MKKKAEEQRTELVRLKVNDFGKEFFH